MGMSMGITTGDYNGGLHPPVSPFTPIPTHWQGRVVISLILSDNPVCHRQTSVNEIPGRETITKLNE